MIIYSLENKCVPQRIFAYEMLYCAPHFSFGKAKS